MPVLEVTLQQGEQVVSTHGELSWMTPNIQLSQHMSTGVRAGGGLMQGLKRVMGGGGLFLTHYEAVSGTGMITFAAKLPGHIMPIDIAPGQAFYVHRHGWLCGTPGITAEHRPAADASAAACGAATGSSCRSSTARAAPGSSCPANSCTTRWPRARR